MAAYYYEILETVENPRVIYKGSERAFIAVSDYVGNKFIVVVYKEVKDAKPDDGFIITAFISNKEQEFRRKEIIWIR